MKKKHVAIKSNPSLKTFFLYAFVVFSVIFVSLSVKAFYVINQSKFDGKNITISVSKNNTVVAILGFDVDNKAISVLSLDKSNISHDLTGEKLGVIADAKISSSINLPLENIDSLLTKSLFKTDGVKTDLTYYDSLRLLLFVKSISENSVKAQQIVLPSNEGKIDEIITNNFSDKLISDESLNVQIVNSTTISGLGKRLERIILNKGGNVVAITSARKPEHESKIYYYGNKSYTAIKIGKLLEFPVEESTERSVGDVVVVIGGDYGNSPAF